MLQQNITVHVWRCRWGRLTCRMRHQSDRQLMSSQGWNIPKVTQLSRITSMDMCSNHVQGVKVKTSSGISYMKCWHKHTLFNIHWIHWIGLFRLRLGHTLLFPPDYDGWKHGFAIFYDVTWPFCKNVIIISSRQIFLLSCCHKLCLCSWVFSLSTDIWLTKSTCCRLQVDFCVDSKSPQRLPGIPHTSIQHLRG